MKKKILGIGIVILALISIGYFGFKNHDYRVTFIANHPKGVVFNTLSEWNKKENTLITKKIPFQGMVMKFELKDSLFLLNWKLESLSDSTTKVYLYAKDDHHSFIQKWKLLYSKTDFSKHIIADAKNLQEELRLHESNYHLSTIDTQTINLENYIYITQTSVLPQKAQSMITSIGTPMGYVKENKLSLNGHPFLQVQNWDYTKNTINFRFCFPLKSQEQYPENDKVTFGPMIKQKSLHCTFKGDYRFSDRAWFYLKEFAVRNKIKVADKPLEIFLNDPHSGGEPITWKAEIYLPIIEND